MGGHPRRKLQAAGNSTAAELLDAAADGKDSKAGDAGSRAMLPGILAGGHRNESALVEGRRAQELGSAGVTLATNQQQQAFRVHAGMQVRVASCFAIFFLLGRSIVTASG